MYMFSDLVFTEEHSRVWKEPGLVSILIERSVKAQNLLSCCGFVITLLIDSRLVIRILNGRLSWVGFPGSALIGTFFISDLSKWHAFTRKHGILV